MFGIDDPVLALLLFAFFFIAGGKIISDIIEDFLS
jgi:hypothetical protein